MFKQVYFSKSSDLHLWRLVGKNLTEASKESKSMEKSITLYKIIDRTA